ncbi:unnamed protein product [Amoebophrya sp. A25]|nr:unnamed protein product [Amoebophrya sp. A25]|eukprot:GSA25T00008472001.1
MFFVNDIACRAQESLVNRTLGTLETLTMVLVLSVFFCKKQNQMDRNRSLPR